MAVRSRVGAHLLVLLLYCWQEGQAWPWKIFSGPRLELRPNLRNLNDDVASVFDEILVQEILDPNKLILLKQQRPAAALPPKQMHKKKEERETLYQIKSLAALEKILDSFRRIIGYSLKKKRRLHKSMLAARYHKRRLNLA